MTIRLDAVRKVRSPPNRAPLIAAMRSRFEEVKNEAEFKDWPRSWPSMNRFSRPTMLRIQAVRMTVMSLLIAPPREASSFNSGS